MAEPMSASTLVWILREEGCRVVEVRDWRTHNRNHRGAWGPINGVMIHHTVTSGTAGSVRLCYDGHSTLPGPLCHGVIAKDGSVYLVGNGRANHAGLGDDDVLSAVIDERALPADNEANVDGNSRFYGFECVNLGDGQDPWPDAQLDAIERVSAAICRHYGWSARSVIGHREWQPGKVDPRGFSMNTMRDRVQARLQHDPEHQEDDVTKDDIQAIAREVVDLLTGPRRKDLVAAIFHTDGVVRAPDHEVAKGNAHWQAETYLPASYNTLKSVESKVDRLAVGGVDVDDLVDKLAQRLAN